MKNKLQEVIMIITYGLLVYLAVWFYQTSEAASAKAAMIYTIILFAIVLIMYIYSFTGFFRVNRMTTALIRFRKKIAKDFQNYQDDERTWEIMWNRYRSEDVWFSEKTLDGQVKKYLTKVRITEQTMKGAFSEDIEDYIGYDLIDDEVHKDVISAFPGIMTGLGILFTFFGLSICLQSFSTASSEEIMAGIDPLMGGLKVAFHTSIYGLIFSMVFNFCYRRKIEDAYKAVRDFLDEYKRCIRPENDNDGFNKLVAYEATQLALMKSMSSTLTADLSDSFYRIMSPQFEQLNNIINNFALAASKTQSDGIQRMVGAFLIEMNNAVGHAFDDVKDSVLKTCETQDKYNVQLQACIVEMTKFIEYARNMSMGMDISVSKMESYFNGMSELHGDIQNGFAGYTDQISYNNELLSQQQECLVRITELQQNINNALQKLQENTAELQASVSDVKVKLQDIGKPATDTNKPEENTENTENTKNTPNTSNTDNTDNKENTIYTEQPLEPVTFITPQAEPEMIQPLNVQNMLGNDNGVSEFINSIHEGSLGIDIDTDPDFENISVNGRKRYDS